MVNRGHRFPVIVLALCGVAVLTTVVIAQSPITQFGYDDASAEEQILKELGNPNSFRTPSVIEVFQKLPAGARGPLVTQLYAWTKARINSATFRKRYAEWRQQNHPVEKKHEGTVEQEVKAKLAKMNAEVEVSYKQLVDAGMKAQADAYRKQSDVMMKGMAVGIQLEVEEARKKDPAEYAVAMKYWEDYYPVDPLTNVAKHLKEYLATTADVDFAAKREQRIGGTGEPYMAFVNEAYNKKPWQWRISYEYGAEVTAAGRAAAAAWLKEIAR